jgi:galactose mutarotase-like enzyme
MTFPAQQANNVTQTTLMPTQWLGQPAMTLETPAVRLVTVPALGGKIVSLYDKVSRHEWLLPPIDRPFRPVAYAAPFADQDMSGWDEMFPTINACAYPAPGPFAGQPLPDHGEVWSLPWAISECSDDALSLTVEGRALPYRFTRSIRALDASTLRLDFAATNTGDTPIAALWTAHPQFVVDEQTRLILPPSVTSVVNVLPTDEWASETAYPWPEATNQRGQTVRLDRIGPASLKSCRKFYLPPDEPVGWAAIQQGASGAWLQLSWDAATVPYLGLWVDEGVYNPTPTAALEPSTGYYDSLTNAWKNARVPTIAPGATQRWHLDIELGIGDRG